MILYSGSRTDLRLGCVRVHKKSPQGAAIG